MPKLLERLWNEYLFDECAFMNTDEERRLAKKAVELHEVASALLNKEQEKAVEAYVDALCDAEALLSRKAFFKGCEFAASFLFEIGHSGKG